MGGFPGTQGTPPAYGPVMYQDTVKRQYVPMKLHDCFFFEVVIIDFVGRTFKP